jgi:hypothetical protein
MGLSHCVTLSEYIKVIVNTINSRKHRIFAVDFPGNNARFLFLDPTPYKGITLNE